ncbi:hypothetical protein NB690_000854 [Xanthomonas sacchari]|nr:hypothetical protein [Xanthomonas sacchari]
MQKKQGNFRVFCNDTLPRSRCGQAAAKRRREPRRCTPACPLAEKKFRDRTRFRHRTSANAQKCANFFASCGAHDARDACVPRRRVAPHRATATRPARTSPTHRDAHDCPRPPPCQVANASSGDAVARSCRPTQLAEVIDWRWHAPRRHASAKRAARTASPMPPRRRPTLRLHATLPCAASENRRRPTRRSSASVTARRDGHAALAVHPAATSHGLRSDARSDAGDARSGIAMPRMALPTRERWRARRAAPKKKPAALGGRFGYRDGRSAQWPSSSSSSAYSSGDSSSFNCSASSASSTRIQPSP